MTRWLVVTVSSCALAVAGLGFAATASGTPSPGATADSPSCVYTLSRPEVVQVSGATMVTTTLSPYPCRGEIVPSSLTVCVKTLGSSTAGNCAYSAGPSMARVSVPYRPGTTYVSTGTGCGSVATTTGSVCSNVGPYSVGL